MTQHFALVLEDEDQVEAALALAQVDADVDAETPLTGEMMDPVTAVLLAGAVAAVAGFLVTLWERIRGGLVIDQSGGAPPSIKRSGEVPYGYVVLIATDGRVTIEVKDSPKDLIERLLEKLIGTVFETAKKAAEAAAEIAGSDKVETEAA